MRSIIERLSRQIVLRRKLPAEFGRRQIYVSPGSALRYWGKIDGVDPKLLHNADKLVRPNDVVWDIGANVGLFAFSAAAKAGAGGTILAVEADAWLVNLLMRSSGIQDSMSAPVRVLSAAVSDSIGVASFHIAGRGRASNHLDGLQNSQAGGTQQIQSVLTVTLDWLLNHFPPPNLVKIDVEGAESLVLAGAERLLSQIRPRILCEVNAKSTEAVTKVFKHYGYLLEDADADTAERRPLDHAAWNTLASPIPQFG
ncbi:MAG: FkbM family methyltransferase [Bryobacteraceae bacterium]